MLSLAACFHFFRLPFMRDSIFVIAFLHDTLGDIFFSFFPLYAPPELSKSLTPQKERPVRMKSCSHSQVAPHIPSQLFRMMQRGSAGGVWPCTIGAAGWLLSLLWDTRPQDLALLCLKRRGVRRCTSQCLLHSSGRLSIPLT